MQPPKQVKPPRNYFRRREQLRLFVLVMCLGLVVPLIDKARDPRSWYWLTGEQDQPASQASPDYDENYDTSYDPPPDESGPGDTIRILPALEPLQDDVDRFFPGVDAGALADVKDHSPFIEGPRAWFNLLEVLQNNSSQLIHQSSTGDVTFVQLFEQPEVYRGQLVTIRGTVKRAEWIEYDQNPAGLKGIVRLVVRTRGGPNRPLVLYAVDKPADFPLAAYVDDEEIEVTGFFYKVWNYPSEIGPLLAPVVLAKDFTWFPAPASEAFAPGLPFMIGMGAVVAMVATILSVVVYRRSLAMFLDSRRGVMRSPPAEAIQRLKDVEAGPSVGEQLRDLASRQPGP